jgi:hypothetical protein
MQPVTVAISPTGIQYMFKNLLGGQIAQALQKMGAAPGWQVQPDDFDYSFDQAGMLYQNEYTNISLTISTGQFQNFSPVFSGCLQGPDGDNSHFAITMSVSNFAAGYPNGWNETYTSQQYYYQDDGCGGGVWYPNGQPQPCNNTYDYSVNLPSLTITAVFKLSASVGSYELTYVQSSADVGGNPQPNIPPQSILNQQVVSCGFGAHVSDATKAAIGKMNWSNAFAQTLNKVFVSIGESGQLGPVTFDFLDPSDTPPVFPTGGGIQLGAKGLVSANGSAYPALPPADLPFPPIPNGNPQPHVTYWVQDYEVSALFWGFFAAGELTATLTKGSIAYPQALETQTYKGGSLDVLYQDYKNKDLVAELKALVPPTVSFANIYQFTADNMAKVQKDVGGSNTQCGQDIASLTPGTYASQAGLEQDLANYPGLMTFAAKIEQDIAVPGVIVEHKVQCALSVVGETTDQPVITFDIDQTFIMQNLNLGVSSTGTTQSLKFTFIQPLDVDPQPSNFSTTLKPLNPKDPPPALADVWSALASSWENAFSATGTKGMPLPRVPGFDFLFDQADIAVTAPVAGADGYISITTNVTYSPEQLAPAVRQMLAQQNTRRAA